MFKSKFGGWILFVACLLLLSFGATPYHKVADTALITVRFSLVLLLSVLVIRERWNHLHDFLVGRGRPADRGDSILRRARRWYYDDDQPGNSK